MTPSLPGVAEVIGSGLLSQLFAGGITPPDNNWLQDNVAEVV